MTPDSAYSPQVINEQDQPMAGTDEHQNGGYHNNNHQQPTNTSPPMDSDPNSRYNTPHLSQQQQPSSRPGSGLGGPQQQQVQHHDQGRQPQKNSIVIKVGMVGDAQIGKTSLMVKYVEGSWDEDYIQTLGGHDRTKSTSQSQLTSLCQV